MCFLAIRIIGEGTAPRGKRGEATVDSRLGGTRERGGGGREGQEERRGSVGAAPSARQGAEPLVRDNTGRLDFECAECDFTTGYCRLL